MSTFVVTVIYVGGRGWIDTDKGGLRGMPPPIGLAISRSMLSRKNILYGDLGDSRPQRLDVRLTVAARLTIPYWDRGYHANCATLAVGALTSNTAAQGEQRHEQAEDANRQTTSKVDVGTIRLRSSRRR